MSDEKIEACDSNGKPFDPVKVERAAMLLVDLHPLLDHHSAVRVVQEANELSLTRNQTPPEVEGLLDMVDELYRKYGVELDQSDTAIAQAARNYTLRTPTTKGPSDE